MLDTLPPIPADPLFTLTRAAAADDRPGKLDLLIGVYRDAGGHTPVLQCVRAAEARLAAESPSKAYRTPLGDARFTAAMAGLLLGPDPARLERQVTAQTVGGTGALRILADMIAQASPGATVWITEPGYLNHRPLMEAAGLTVRTYGWCDRAGALDMDGVMDDLEPARAGDVILIHGCCHNPTGIDMPMEGWAALSSLCAGRGLVPLVDIAYQGFGDGMEADAAGLRAMADALGTVLVAASCSKNMGLYSERTGVASVICPRPELTATVGAALACLARRSYSTPPHHGAAVATALLTRPEPWLMEVEAMRLRVLDIRVALASALAARGLPDRFGVVARQKGMFSLLPVAADTMQRLRADFGIYGLDNGRINLAGLTPDGVDRLADALAGLSREPALSRLAS